MSNISITNLQPISDESISRLSAEETENISGGFVWIAAFVGGAAVGYRSHKAADAIAGGLRG